MVTYKTAVDDSALIAEENKANAGFGICGQCCVV